MSGERSNGVVPNKSLFDRLMQSFGSEPRNRSEVLQALRDAQKRGHLDGDALAMIEGVFEVAEMQVRDIMVPRAQMVIVEDDWQPDAMLPVIIESGHSRFPVIGENRDEVEGVLLAKDLLRYMSDDDRAQFDINDILRPAVFVPEAKRLNTLLKEFRSSRNHMAIVVDEYGGVAGLVTIEDVLEQIVGDIDDEHDAEEDVLIRPRGRGRYSVRALTPLDDFNDYFNCELDHEEVDTVGGLVMSTLGHVPIRGETVEINDFAFRVLAADSRRVYLLRVTPPSRVDTADGR
jgi:magnesium and cobalt transporter